MYKVDGLTITISTESYDIFKSVSLYSVFLHFANVSQQLCSPFLQFASAFAKFKSHRKILKTYPLSRLKAFLSKEALAIFAYQRRVVVI